MTDGLEQYHKLAREQEGLINANCLAHARCHFANAIKAMGKGNGERSKPPWHIRRWCASEPFTIWKEP